MKRVCFFVVAVFCAGVVVAGPSRAAWQQEFDAAWKRAGDAVTARDAPAMVRELSRALELARDQAPLVVTQAHVVDAPHMGLGVYTPIKHGAVKGTALKLYVELDNVTPRALPDQRAELVVDVVGHFSALNDDGTVKKKLGRVPLGSQTVQTWRATGVHSLGLDVSMGDAPPGRYSVELEVTDRVGSKTAKKALPFALLP